MFLMRSKPCLGYTASMLSESIPTAQQWNKDVVGWNLGNEFECSAPGQDGESMQIGNPDGSIHAETAWGNPVVTKKMIASREEGWFQCHSYSNPLAVPHYQSSGDEHRQGLDCSHQGGGGLVSWIMT